MSYRIQDAKPGFVAFKDSPVGRNILGGCLLAVGLLLSLGALAKMLTGPLADGPPLIGMSILILAGSVLVITQIRPPKFLLLDDSKGALIICEKTMDQATALIPYSAFEEIRTARGLPSRNRRRTFGVDLVKKDGVRYAIFETRTLKAAEEATALLKKNVDLRSRDNASPIVSSTFKKENKNDAIKIEWRMPVRVMRTILSAAMATGFSILLIESYASVPVFLFWPLQIFLCTIAVLSLAYLFYPRKQVVTVDGIQLKAEVTGIFAKQLIVPLREIASVQFQFAAAWEDTIYLLNEHETAVMRAYQEGTLDPQRALEIGKMMLQAKRIPSGGLTASEMISLEQILEGTLTDQGRAVQ